MRRVLVVAIVAFVPACGRLLGLDEEDEPARPPASSSADAGEAAAFDAAAVADADADDAPADPCVSCASRHCASGGDGGVACDPLVFVTAETYAGDFAEIENLTGIAKLDEACQRSAATAGLTGKVFKAWASISMEGVTPERFVKSSRPYWRRDGKRVAASYQALVTTGVESWIAATASGDELPDFSFVWTATLPNGAADPRDCSGWTVGTNQSKSIYGVTGCVTQTPCTPDYWSFHGSSFCNAHARLYCFEQLP